MDKLSPNVLIIGGTGFIGSHLCRKCISEGFRVTSLSSQKIKKKNIIESVNYVFININNHIKIKKILQFPFEYIVNLSGYIDHRLFYSGGDKVILNHFESLKNILAHMNKDKLKKFIQIGSSDEYGQLKAPQNEDMREMAISPYSFSKIASTHLLQMLNITEDLPCLILRPFITYGPKQKTDRFLPQIILSCLNNKKFPTTLGNQHRDFCYIDDTVNAIFLSIKSKYSNGTILNIGTGQPIKIIDIINKVKNSIGRGNPQLGKIKLRKNENLKLFANNNKIKKLLGWKPIVTLEEGLDKTINYYKNKYEQ